MNNARIIIKMLIYSHIKLILIRTLIYKEVTNLPHIN